MPIPANFMFATISLGVTAMVFVCFAAGAFLLPVGFCLVPVELGVATVVFGCCASNV